MVLGSTKTVFRTVEIFLEYSCSVFFVVSKSFSFFFFVAIMNSLSNGQLRTGSVYKFHFILFYKQFLRCNLNPHALFKLCRKVRF